MKIMAVEDGGFENLYQTPTLKKHLQNKVVTQKSSLRRCWKLCASCGASDCYY